MRNVLLALFFLVSCAVHAAERDLLLSRAMLEDAVLRDDADGIRLARGRIVEIAADSPKAEVHYLIGLSAFFEATNAWRDSSASARLIQLGLLHADRAIELDPKHADAWMLSSTLRFYARTPDPSRLKRAIDLDPNAPLVSFISGITRSMNPAGPANPEGVRIFDQMAARESGFWKAQADVWRVLVRTADNEPDAAKLGPMIAELLERHPDFALAQVTRDSLEEHRFASAPSLEWQPLLTDAAGDGKTPGLPDVVAVDRADASDRVWFRVAFAERLPRSFGVNVVVNRSGDATGMKWWGAGSTFRFDRLVTAWITRAGDDRYFGRVGVTDDDGARGQRFTKLSGDVAIAMNDRSVIIGVPQELLGLTDKSAIVVAGGSHLVWNDDATSSAKPR